MRNLQAATKKRRGLFQTQCEVEPAIVIVETDANNPEEAPVEYLEIVKPLKKKRKRYLPGERLLIKMNKEREKKSNKQVAAARGTDRVCAG